MQPAPARHAFVLGLDGSGKIVHDLQDTGSNAYAPITSALEHEGKLYLGSLWREGFAIAQAP